jgi:hypothetical protein
MSMYRKKPVVIEAVQWNPKLPPDALPDWLWKELMPNPEYFDGATGELKIKTLEGVMTAKPGDYIIQGIKGEIYPCKPDIFEATYEAISI